MDQSSLIGTYILVGDCLVLALFDVVSEKELEQRSLVLENFLGTNRTLS